MYTTKVSDIMSPNVITVTPEMSLRDVATLLSEHHLSGAPVVLGRRVLGVVSASDVLRVAGSPAGMVAGSQSEPEWDEEPEPWREGSEPPAEFYTQLEPDAEAEIDPDTGDVELLERVSAADVMTRVLCALPPDASIVEAANYMLWADVHRILVTEQDELIGIVSTMDIVRAVAQKMG
ncbi:MAG TPA: CBS domain-containing protein [Gemmatimonadaceae bacterium]|nr:CBS domain-containing protein [Gemmatimonadaceae bacterium]